MVYMHTSWAVLNPVRAKVQTSSSNLTGVGRNFKKIGKCIGKMCTQAKDMKDIIIQQLHRESHIEAELKANLSRQKTRYTSQLLIRI